VALTIRTLTTDTDITAAYPLMFALRDRISHDTFLPEIRRQQQDGYELVGGFVDGALVALAGIRPCHTLSRGAHLFVDDLVTDAACRGVGHGTAMLEWIARARERGMPRVYLDSRATARGFYERLGFTFLTSIPCWIDSDRL
jgi:ribosomal protein S18 acetylase RimI-like enzyme